MLFSAHTATSSAVLSQLSSSAGQLGTYRLCVVGSSRQEEREILRASYLIPWLCSVAGDDEAEDSADNRACCTQAYM